MTQQKQPADTIICSQQSSDYEEDLSKAMHALDCLLFYNSCLIKELEKEKNITCAIQLHDDMMMALRHHCNGAHTTPSISTTDTIQGSAGLTTSSTTSIVGRDEEQEEGGGRGDHDDALNTAFTLRYERDLCHNEARILEAMCEHYQDIVDTFMIQRRNHQGDR